METMVHQYVTPGYQEVLDHLAESIRAERREKFLHMLGEQPTVTAFTESVQVIAVE